jgi:O-antigen/teichoic acid export membrane protein
VFSAALVNHGIVALAILVLAETVGLWLFKHKLVVPVDRMEAAMWVFQFAVLGCMVSLIQVPYTAAIVAHEKMDVYAYIALGEVVLRLSSVYLLLASPFDRLKLFAVLIFAMTLAVALAYGTYCSKTYEECKFRFFWDLKLNSSLFAYSIWELYGGFAIMMGMGQGINMLLNSFFGPRVNAARGIATQVQSAVTGLGNNFMTAVTPHMIKQYAGGNETHMIETVFVSSRFAFFLTYLFTLPLLLETPYILDLWLKTVPEHTVAFCRLILINNLIWSMRSAVVNSFHAAGRIKAGNLICGSLFYLVLILSYASLKAGLPAEAVFVNAIVVSVLVQFTELVLLKRYILYSVRAYIKTVMVPCYAVAASAAFAPLVLTLLFSEGFGRFFAVGSISVVSVGLSTLFLGLDSETRRQTLARIATIVHR